MKTIAKPKAQNLEPYAFFAGAHGVPLNDTLLEIQTAHTMERTKAEEESVRRLKPLEATVQQLQLQRQHVDDAWDAIVHRLGRHAPPIAAAIAIAIFGFAALVVDAALLGPGLDALGIADTTLQFFSAFGLAALSAATFHLAYETFGPHHHAAEIVIARRALAVIATFSLLAWGILRGYQARFAADLTGNPLGSFLASHVMLASIFFAFITLAAPVIGAAAYHDAMPKIHGWLTWTRCRGAHEALHTELASTEKRIEEEREALEKVLANLDAQEANWEAIATQYHRRGREGGARQVPLWMIVSKASGWSMGGLAAACPLGGVFPVLYFALPIGTWLASFFYYYRVRMYPNYDEFKRHENIHFAVRTDRPSQKPTSPSLPTPKEDSK